MFVFSGDRIGITRSLWWIHWKTRHRRILLRWIQSSASISIQWRQLSIYIFDVQAMLSNSMHDTHKIGNKEKLTINSFSLSTCKLEIWEEHNFKTQIYKSSSFYWCKRRSLKFIYYWYLKKSNINKVDQLWNKY